MFAGIEKSLATGFGRSLFLSFILVAAVPVGLVTVYALGYFANVYVKQHEARLFDAVRAQGHLVVERLQHARRLINAGPELISADSPVFIQIAPVASNGTVPRLEVDPLRLYPVAFIFDREGEHFRAALDPRFLWGGLVTAPVGIQMCFFTRAGNELKCELEEGALDPDLVFQLMPSQYQSTFELEIEGQRHFAASWELFLLPDFAADNWKVVGFEAAGAVTAPFGLRSFLPGLVLLSLAMAALVALYSLRKRLKPFGELAAATRRMSRSDFSSPVVINSGDELQTLGESFNNMMSQLGGQIRRLQVDTEVDRMILDSSSMDTVLDLVLKNGFHYVDCRWMCIGLIDPANPEIAVVQQALYGDQVEMDSTRVTLTESARQLISNAGLPCALNKQADELDGLIPASDEGSRFLVNVSWNNVLLGFICLQVKHRRSLDTKTGLQLAELRDRVTLALSASEKEKALFQQAHFDELTGLPNRYLLTDRLRQQCAHGATHSFAVLFLDLDRFKNINDSLGHSAGDELLKSVATQLARSFPQPHTVARLGGDEFVVLLEECSSPAVVSEQAKRLLDDLAGQARPGSGEAQVSASIGVALYPEDGSTPEELLRNADAAMYQSKDDGRSRVTFFTPEINAAVTQRFTIEAEIRKALQNDDFAVVFQPQRSLSEEKIVGMEALVRWPQSGYGPDEFVPVAEEAGLVGELGDWVLDAACRVFATIDKPLRPQQFSVNVSVRQCEREDFVERTLATLEKHGLEPENLEVEITESVLVDGVAGVKRTISRLSEAGVNLALDDFGTGYSSLKYLQEMPIDVIKIDRSFVVDVDADTRQRAFIETVVHLARRLGKRTVAEGAETEPELLSLRHLGCDAAQGYFVSRPVSESELVAFLREFRDSTAVTGRKGAALRSVS